MFEPIVLYFHGYGSSPRTDKVTDLKKVFVDVRAPQVPLLYEDAERELSAYVEEVLAERRDVIIVGTSLGGYWAGAVGAKYNIPAVLVNPATDPERSLSQFNDSMLSSVELSKFPRATASSSARIVLLAEDDDIINPQAALDLFSGNAKVVRYQDGGHRFQCPERIADAVKYLIQYETSDICND